MAIRGGTGTIGGGRVGGSVGGGRIGGSVGNGPKGMGSEGVRISLGGERGIAGAVPASMTKSSFGEALRAAARPKVKSQSNTRNPFTGERFDNIPIGQHFAKAPKAEAPLFGPIVRRGSVAIPRAEARPAKPLNIRNLSEWNPAKTAEPKVVVKLGSFDKPNNPGRREQAPRVVRKDLPNTIGIAPEVKVSPRTVEPAVQPTVRKSEVKPQVAAEHTAKAVRLASVRKALAAEPQTRPLPTWTEPVGLPVHNQRLVGLAEKVITDQRANGKPESRIQKLLGSSLAARQLALLAQKEDAKAEDETKEKKVGQKDYRQDARAALQKLRTTVAKQLRSIGNRGVQAEPLQISQDVDLVKNQVDRQTAQVTRGIDEQQHVRQLAEPIALDIEKAEAQALATAKQIAAEKPEPDKKQDQVGPASTPAPMPTSEQQPKNERKKAPQFSFDEAAAAERISQGLGGVIASAETDDDNEEVDALAVVSNMPDIFGESAKSGLLRGLPFALTDGSIRPTLEAIGRERHIRRGNAAEVIGRIVESYAPVTTEQGKAVSEKDILLVLTGDRDLAKAAA